MINQTKSTEWPVEKILYQDTRVPIIYGAKSDGWTATTTLHMPYSSTIDIMVRISNDSIDIVSVILSKGAFSSTCTIR